MNRTLPLAVLLFAVSVASPTWGERNQGTRWAVLIGVNDYAALEDLKFCSGDMLALKTQLVAAGFDADQVFLVHDRADDKKYLPFKSNIEQHLNNVLGFAEEDDMIVVAFSGHGMYFDGRTYLCPTNADPERPDTLLALDEVYGKLKSCRANLRVLIVDACRNDPRPAGRKSGTPKQDLTKLGEAFQKPPQGIVLLSSCAPGEISYESKDFGRGVFMNYLLEAVSGKADGNGDSQVSISEAAQYAGRKTKVYVAREFFTSQRPFLTGDLSTEVLAYSLTRSAPATSRIPMVPARPARTTNRAPTVPSAPAPASGKEFTNSIGMKMKLIPAGEFVMGSAKTPRELCRMFNLSSVLAQYFKGEQPQHRVRITKPFYLAATEVTQGQWEAVMETRPWKKEDVKEGSDYAATGVSWEDAQAFCEALSKKEGATYRLPTEAEWEYACRAGTTTMYSFGDDASKLGEYAWCRENASDVDEKYAHRVGQKQPNPFGLYDMHGNVLEWCADWYDEDYYSSSPTDDPKGPASAELRMLRGGGWYGNPVGACSAHRSAGRPDDWDDYWGFRVATTP